MRAWTLLGRSLAVGLLVVTVLAGAATPAFGDTSAVVTGQAVMPDIPGQRLNGTTYYPGYTAGVTATLTAGADAVYGVSVLANDTLTITLSSNYPTDLYLYPSDATTVYDRSRAIAVSALPGTETITFKVPASGVYYIDVHSTASRTARFSLRCGIHRVLTKVSLTTPTRPASARLGRTFVTTGYLKPRHPAGAQTVIIYGYKYRGGRWQLDKVTSATNSNYSTYTRYTKRMTLPSRGLWRLRAFTIQDERHLATYSGYSTVFRVY